jgi:tetratricopeptide (TPR) repeat protein
MRLAFTCAVIAVALLVAAAPPSVAERLAQHRNLGKAFYENPTTQNEAVAEFKAALALAPNSNREKLNYALALLRAAKADQAVALLREVQKNDPRLPHTWFNLGIYYKKAGDTAAATAQFERLIELAPDEPIAHYQLGTLYRQSDRAADARAQFERAAALNPLLAAARFQLYNLYRQAGRSDDAAKMLAEFQSLKKQQEGAVIPEDVDWCTFAEIYDPPSERGTPVPATISTPKLDFPATGATLIGDGDLLAWSPAKVVLYRGGKEVRNTGLENLTGVISIALGDFDNDGLMDLCILTEAGPLLYRNTKDRFVPFAANLPHRRFERAVWIDYDHDYDLDLILLGDAPALLRNEGSAGFADRTADFPFAEGHPTEARKFRVDPDSKAFDLAVWYADRAPVLYRDQLGGRYTTEPYNAPAPNPLAVDSMQLPAHWIRVQLEGVKSLKLAQDAQVEVRAGTLYQKRAYEGVPLVFGIGAYTSVDVVRITWPNGLIQNEVKQAGNHSYVYKEAQRLSGSCPMIWTWNGRGIQFITDVLGVAPLGASDGEGTYFPVDHDEFVTIPGAALAPVNGQYDIRVTEELSEVSYLDQIQLYAVDHPASTEIYTNEKFKGPPYPEDRLYGVDRRIYPKSAHDDQGHDVLPALLQRDQVYPDQFPRTELGVARPHTLELDFSGAAADGRAVLFLNGWVDWPDGSTFRAASQEFKGGLVMPYLQMQDAAGQWITVNEDMGMPAGKPKTIAVELRFPSASRKLRIVTSLCVYWDEIFLGESPSAPPVRRTPVPMLSANLHFRGFSAARIHPERKQPDTFFYGSVSPVSFWNPTSGLYTRYGDVLPLLREVDDRLVVMGSGDEILLRFDAALPPLPAGWTRDFLLKVDGWAKDRDPNTAYGTTVEPLPFHAMSRYPYPANEHFPDDESHRQYRRDYNTRPALRLIRNLSQPGTN